jgi:hypothetical protein
MVRMISFLMEFEVLIAVYFMNLVSCEDEVQGFSA